MAIILPRYNLKVPSETTMFRDLGKELREFGQSINDALADFDYNGADPNLVLSRVTALEGYIPSKLKYFSGTQAERLAASPPNGSVWQETAAPYLTFVRIGTTWYCLNRPYTFTAAADTTLSPSSFLRKNELTKEVSYLLKITRTVWPTGTPLVATVPTGCRPDEDFLQPAAQNGAAAPSVQLMQFNTAGGVHVITPPTNGQLWARSLSGLFRSSS